MVRGDVSRGKDFDVCNLKRRFIWVTVGEEGMEIIFGIFLG